MRNFSLAVVGSLLTASVLLSGCATMIEGPISRVKYEGGPGKLAFYTDSGKRIVSEHSFDDHNQQHLNFIELDKRQKRHVIIARHADEVQIDTFDRRVNYYWLIPSAMLVYGFPVSAGVDMLTGSIYTFPDRQVRLSSQMIAGGMPEPETTSFEQIRQPDRSNLVLGGYVGLLLPFESEPSGWPSFGAQAGMKLGYGLWGTVGYQFGNQLRQSLGNFQRSYRTVVHSSELGIQYQPIDFAYLIGALAYDHMIFERAFGREDEEPRRFGRNLISGKFGAGIYLSGMFLEYRRVLGLSRIETPEGPGHAIAYTNIRFGAAFRIYAPWGK